MVKKEFIKNNFKNKNYFTWFCSRIAAIKLTKQCIRNVAPCTRVPFQKFHSEPRARTFSIFIEEKLWTFSKFLSLPCRCELCLSCQNWVMGKLATLPLCYHSTPPFPLLPSLRCSSSIPYSCRLSHSFLLRLFSHFFQSLSFFFFFFPPKSNFSHRSRQKKTPHCVCVNHKFILSLRPSEFSFHSWSHFSTLHNPSCSCLSEQMRQKVRCNWFNRRPPRCKKIYGLICGGKAYSKIWNSVFSHLRYSYFCFNILNLKKNRDFKQTNEHHQ